MFFEFVQHLALLDLHWIVSLVMNNILWVFMLGAFIYFLNDGKKLMLGFAVVVADIWLWQQFEAAANAVVFAGAFLALYYITKLALVAFVESTPQLSKKLLLVFALQGWVVLVIYNLLG